MFRDWRTNACRSTPVSASSVKLERNKQTKFQVSSINFFRSVGLVEVIYTEIYTDFLEAFNRVQHDILLHKPSNYGLNEGVININ